MNQHHTSSTRIHFGMRVNSHMITGLLGLCVCLPSAGAQSENSTELALKLQQLTDAVTVTQRQLEKSQQELQQLRAQLASLQQQIANFQTVNTVSSQVSELSTAVDQIREQESIQQAQIATHEQAKVESESKYPLKLSGLVLLNAFVNSTQVDDPVAPTLMLPGSGTTGLSVRQTVLGLDARGPLLLNARSHADLRADFYGAGSGTAGAYPYAGGLLRLRTAHADLEWEHTRAFFALDHTILAPNTPASLTAIAVPALGWSGNLWTWNPQFGLTQDFALPGTARFRAQGALIDMMDPPQSYSSGSAAPPGIAQPSRSEMSRWPGAEARLALLSGDEDAGIQAGIGGLYVPHRTTGGTRFDSWASTVDYRIPLPGRAEFSGGAYWGQALGGLGGGAYKDYVFSYSPTVGYSFRALDNMGGWAQFKERVSERLELNAAFGTDQVPASQLRPFAGNQAEYYLNQARNRTFTANVICRPSAYLMFSLEYRHIQSSPVLEYTATGDVIGIATGYRF